VAGSAGLLALMASMAGSGGLSGGVGSVSNFLRAPTSQKFSGRVGQLTDTAASERAGKQVSIFRQSG
jgi:hypothetical protein